MVFCNVNRIQQTPVSYVESIVKEVKLRLEIKDEEVKSVFIECETIKNRGDDSIAGDVPSKEHVIEDIPKIASKTPYFRKEDKIPPLYFNSDKMNRAG